jgi:putative flippase GtrA
MRRGGELAGCPNVFWTLLTHPRPLLWFRFGLAGLLNTGFGYVVFAALELMGVWPGAALAGSTIAGIGFNFQTSRRFVFRSKGHVLSFVALYTVVFSLNWAALRALGWYGLPDLESQALLVPPIAFLSFFGQQLLVFGEAAGSAGERSNRPAVCSPPMLQDHGHRSSLMRPHVSRLLIPGCGIFFVALFGVLYWCDTALYLRVLVWLIKEPFPHPFIDWEEVPSAIQCWQHGVDVYVNNTCYEPFAHGRHGYSPLWLRMTFLPYGKAWVAAFGLSLAVLFFAALVVLPPQRNIHAFCVTALATISPLTAFALERANVDLIMFLLAIAGVNCWLSARPSRLAGYGLFIVGGLLKFYPFVLMALALRERPRMFAAICTVTLVVLLAFGLTFRDELARVGANFPAGLPFDDIFAAASLPYGLGMMAGVSAPGLDAPLATASRGMAGPAGLLLLTLLAIGCALLIERKFKLTEVLGAMPRRDAGFLVAAAAIVCGCFFAGQNVGYRAIMILPALPGLLWFGRSLPTRRGRVLFTASGWSIVFIMWSIFIQQVVAAVFIPFGAMAFFHWLLNQLAWWSVVTVLLAVLLSFVLGSEIGRLTMLHLQPRSANPIPPTKSLLT